MNNNQNFKPPVSITIGVIGGTIVGIAFSLIFNKHEWINLYINNAFALLLGVWGYYLIEKRNQ